MKKRSPCFLALVATCTIAAAPCGSAVIPNLIGLGPPESVTSLNPLFATTTANQQLSLLLFRPLVWIGQDDRMDAGRSLAASITALDGNRRMRVALKPWMWSDGAPVTADDAVFTWERIQKLGNLFAFFGQGGIPDRLETVRAIDAHTVDFLLRKPTSPAWFALNGLSDFSPLPRHAWGDVSVDDMWERQTDAAMVRVVDGPFRLDAFRPHQYAVLVPNPRYGGTPPHLARLAVLFLEGASPLAALRAGELDMAHVPMALWNKARSLPGFTALTLQEPFGYRAAILNQKNNAVAFLRDARVRRALADAADQKTMIDVVFHGYSHEARVVVPVVPPTWLSPAARAGTLAVRSDKARARTELEAAGWHVGPDGIRNKDGKKLAFAILARAGEAETSQVLQLWQRDLRDVGVLLTIRLVDFSQIDATLYGPPEAWDSIFLTESVVGMPDGTGHFDTGGDFSGGYSNQKMDDLIRASIEQPGSQALFDYEDFAAQEQPVVMFPQAEPLLLVANRLGGVESFVNPQSFWAPEELFVRDQGCRAAK